MSGTIDDMITMVSAVYDLAINYYNNDVAKANLHTMEWVRNNQYWDPRYVTLLAPDIPDYVFFGIVEAGKYVMPITRINSFTDPSYKVDYGVPHLFYTMNGVYLNRFAAITTTPNTGDIAGWGGDYCGFYGDWWNATAGKKRVGALAGDAWSLANLAATAPPSPYDFHIRDWIEDADGFNIARLLASDPTMSLPTAMNQYFKPSGKSGYKTRIQTFYQDRFTGDPKTAAATAFWFLFALADNQFSAFREGLIFHRVNLTNQFNNSKPTTEEALLFCKGLGDKFEAMVAAEKAMP